MVVSLLIPEDNCFPHLVAKKVNSRKSNVVKEIEKIQEQRVQRRAAASNNAAAYSGVDKSHPHWQFLDMIE